MGLERIIFFSDALIAFAITLLALEIRLPESVTSPADLGHQLWLVKPQCMSFIISFFVISLFWMNHQRAFEKFKTLTLA